MFTPCTEPLRPGCHNFSFLLQSRGCSTCGNSLYSQAVCQEQPPRGPLVTTGSFSSSSSVMKSFSNTVEEKSLRQIWASLLHFWVVEEEECVCCNAGSQPWVVGWRRRFWSPLVSRREQSAGVEDFFYFFFLLLSSRGVTVRFHMYSTFEQIPNERFWKCFWFRVPHLFTVCVPSLISGHF